MKLAGNRNLNGAFTAARRDQVEYHLNMCWNRYEKVTRRLWKTYEAWTEPVRGMYDVSLNVLPKLDLTSLSSTEKRWVGSQFRSEDKVLDQRTRLEHYGPSTPIDSKETLL